MAKYLYLLIASILIILGLVCYFVQTKIPIQTNPGLNTIFGNLGSAVLICGLLNLLQDLITKKYDDDRLRELLGISLSIKQSLLKTILTDSSEYNYKDIIMKSINFHAIMNDGLRWIGNNSAFLEKRFSKKATMTEFYLVNPEGMFCPALALKTEKEVCDLQSKIKSSVDQIEATFNRSKRQGTLRIYYLKNYPTQTLFYSDDSVIVTPYQTSSGRSIIPLYEYKYIKGEQSIASHLFGDLKNVREESVLISENGKRISLKKEQTE